jgi:hypothetical protein
MLKYSVLIDDRENMSKALKATNQGKGNKMAKILAFGILAVIAVIAIEPIISFFAFFASKLF